MKHAILIHGYKGDREEHWFPWLTAYLQAAGWHVDVPQFPTPDNQDREHWLEVIDGYNITEDTRIIAHSLGVPFALHVVEIMPVHSVYAVAGFTGKLGTDVDNAIADIAQQDFDWKRIQKHANEFVVLQSDNDAYVPQTKTEELAESLGVEPITISGAGHFNTASGYGPFPELRELLLAE